MWLKWETGLWATELWDPAIGQEDVGKS